MTYATISIKVIFDNGGGTTVQARDEKYTYAHYYGDAGQAAGDVRDMLENGFRGFDGDEADAAKCDPTSEELRNGGYKIERFDSRESLNEHAHAEYRSGWANEAEFARDTLKKIL